MLRLSLSVALAFAPALNAQEWPQFRGPGGLGVAGSTSIPNALGPDQNVLWSTDIPAGHSSPCIVGKRLFITGFEDGKCTVLALDRTTGEILWKKPFSSSKLRQYMHPDAVPALPTPVADEERVIGYFATYGLVALDFDGKLLWEKRLSDPGHVFGLGSSPLLFDGLLIVARDGSPEAGILGLDATDGSELWRIDRFGFSESHGTPFLWRNADRDELVIGGTHRLVSYDLGTGKELWFVDGLTNFPCTTPTGDDDTLYFAAWSTPNATGRSLWEATFSSLDLSDDEIQDPAVLFKRLDTNRDGKIYPAEVPESRAKDSFAFLDRDQSGYWEVPEFVSVSQFTAPGKNLMVAVARGAEGDASKKHVRWSHSRGLPYVASPLLHQGRIWLVKSGGIISCLDAKTGDTIIDRERLEDRGEYYSSPIGAGDKVLFGSAEGTFFILDGKADELKILHSATFDGELFATPAILDGTVYLRSKTKMWAFAQSSN